MHWGFLLLLSLLLVPTCFAAIHVMGRDEDGTRMCWSTVTHGYTRPSSIFACPSGLEMLFKQEQETGSETRTYHQIKAMLQVFRGADWLLEPSWYQPALAFLSFLSVAGGPMPTQLADQGDELSMLWSGKRVYVNIANIHETMCGSYAGFTYNRECNIKPCPGVMRMMHAEPAGQHFTLFREFIMSCTNLLTGYDLRLD